MKAKIIFGEQENLQYIGLWYTNEDSTDRQIAQATELF